MNTSSSNTITNIKKVSLVFFIVTGLLHLGSSVFLANKLFLKTAFIFNKTMDIPFIITGMIYGLSSLRLNLTNPDRDHKKLDIFLISVIILVLLSLIAMNIFLPDLQG